MDLLFDAVALQIAGLILIAAVLLQTLLWLLGTVRQTAVQRRQQQLALELLRHQVETARAQHRLAVDERQSWGGHRKFVVHQLAHAYFIFVGGFLQKFGKLATTPAFHLFKKARQLLK